VGKKPVFTAEQEKELANQILKLANTFYGMSQTHLRKVAYEFAEANCVVHNYDRSSRQASKDWLQHFMNRNTEVSLRKPEPMSVNRIGAFNEMEIKRFFINL
jgi:hypothetical protein